MSMRTAGDRLEPVPSREQGADAGAALRRRWPVVLLAGAVAAGCAFAVSEHVLPVVYESSTTIIVKGTVDATPGEAPIPAEPFVDDQSLSETFEQLALQPSIVSAVAADLGMRPSQLETRVRVNALPRTPLVVISFQDSTPRRAARGAQAYAARFVQTSQGNAFLPGRALVVSGATLPDQPSGPRTLLNTLAAGLAGLLAALLVVTASSKVRRPRMRDPRETATPSAASAGAGAEGRSNRGWAAMVTPDSNGSGLRTGS